MSRAHILAYLNQLPRTQQRAAAYAIRHSNDLPFLTVREFAAKAGVTPSTIMRMIEALGYSNYRAFRDSFRATQTAESVKPSASAWPQPGLGESHLGQFKQVERLTEHGLPQQIEQAAALMMDASQIHVGGFRSAYSFAHYLAYMGKMVNPLIHLIPNALPLALDYLQMTGEEDILILFSVAPYTAQMIELAQRGVQPGTRMIAITDSLNSPLARCASITLAVEPVQLQYINTMTGTLAVTELLLEAYCGQQERAARRRIQQFRDQQHRRQSYWSDTEDPGQSTAKSGRD